jgi:ribosome biogenesis protein Nip4
LEGKNISLPKRRRKNGNLNGKYTVNGWGKRRKFKLFAGKTFEFSLYTRRKMYISKCANLSFLTRQKEGNLPCSVSYRSW